MCAFVINMTGHLQIFSFTLMLHVECSYFAEKDKNKNKLGLSCAKLS